MSVIPWMLALVQPTADGGFLVDKRSIQSVDGDPDLLDPDEPGAVPNFAGEMAGAEGLTEGELAAMYNDDDEEDDDDAPAVTRQILELLEGEFSEMGAPLTPEEREQIRAARRENKAKEAKALRALRALRKKDRHNLRDMRHKFHQPGNQATHKGHTTTAKPAEDHMKGEWTTWFDTMKIPAGSANALVQGSYKVDYDEVMVEDMTIQTADTGALLQELRVAKHRFIESDTGIPVGEFDRSLLKRPDLRDRSAKEGQTIYANITAGGSPADIFITLKGKKFVRHGCPR